MLESIKSSKVDRPFANAKHARAYGWKWVCRSTCAGSRIRGV